MRKLTLMECRRTDGLALCPTGIVVKRGRLNGACLTALVFGVALLARADTSELVKEIDELKAKIGTTRDRIQQTQRDIEKDRASFAAYEKGFSSSFSRSAAEVDSLTRDYRALRQSADSIGRVVQGVRARQRELDLRKKTLATVLLASCDSLLEVLAGLPDEAAAASTGALSFLRGELASGSVDNVEALERLWQIHTEWAQSANGIDVYTAPSPVPFIDGQVSFIRISYCYFAVVDEEGENAALWHPPSDSTKGVWRRVEDESARHALQKCVQVRQGTIVPQLVDLPFLHGIVADTPDGGGGL